MSETAQFRAGSRRSRRLVVQLIVAVGMACALMAWASHELVKRTFEEQLTADLDHKISAAAAAVEKLRQEAERSVARLSTFLQQDDPEGLGRLMAGGVGATGDAARLMGRAKLQWLEILDDRATVVSSATWPEQAGLLQEDLLELPAERAQFREVATASEDVPAFVVRRELRIGSRVLHLVGGVLLDEAALQRLSGDGSWLRVTRADGETYRVGGPRVDPVLAWQGVAGLARAEVSGRDGNRWIVARQRIAGGENIDAWLLTAVSRDASDRRRSGVARALTLLAVLAAILAGLCGLWIARRATAPVAELVRSVDAIAAGTEDYTFTRSTADEFEELTTSFSRLHRSLELQRQRSRAAERVAAWREVARRVAHEVKNPLAPIRLTVENLIRARRRGGPLFDEMFDEGAGTILEEVDRLKRLVGEFSEFARLPLPDPRPTDLAGLVDDVVALYGSEPSLVVEVRHAPNLPLVRLDPDQTSRALSNVIGNAIEAMRALPPDRARRLAVRTGTEEDGIVRIDVDDSGPGLSPEALEKLFEPYFSTKESGTGLGLSITYRIVTEHGGVIVAGNLEEGGVRVTVRLSVAGPDPVASSTGAYETREANS